MHERCAVSRDEPCERDGQGSENRRLVACVAMDARIAASASDGRDDPAVASKPIARPAAPYFRAAATATDPATHGMMTPSAAPMPNAIGQGA